MEWILVAVVLVLFGVACLASLGAMREIVVLRSEVAALRQLVTLPPEPGWLQTEVAPPLLLNSARDHLATISPRIALVFVESGCPSCRALIERTTAAEDIAGRVLFVLIDKDEGAARTQGMIGEIEAAGMRWTLDQANELRASAGVYGTPTAVLLGDSEPPQFKAGADGAWLLNALREPAKLSISEVAR